MLNELMSSIFSSSDSLMSSVSTASFFACTITSIVLGLCVVGIYMFRHKYSKNFVVTLALLPLIVQVVIMLVNGNLGAGIAVMGVFNLVRFRSVPGSAKDIASVFLAMAIGLACGMGYLGIAVVFTIIVGIVNIVYVISPLGREQQQQKVLKITVPEDLNYEGVFNPVLEKYASTHSLESVQTTNMGSLFQLEYSLRLKEAGTEKSLIDELRVLNGNCKIFFGQPTVSKEVL